MTIRHPQEQNNLLADIEAQQRRLFRVALIALIVGEVITAPLMLIVLGGPVGATVAVVQGIATCAAIIALVQLRTVGLQRALAIATSGFLGALALLYIAFGLRASIPFLSVALVPLAWTAMLGGVRLTWLTIGSSILMICVAALEALDLPWIGVVHVAEFPSIVAVMTITAILFVVGWFLLQSGQTLRTAVTQGDIRQRELELLRDSLETTVAARTASLQQALHAVEAREAQLSQTLADLHTSQAIIRELSAPVIPVLAGVLVVPLVGALDSARAARLAEQVLRAVEQRGTRMVILDVTGLPIVDTQVAHVLSHTAAAVQLLGARVVIVGIRPEVAQTMVALQIDVRAITTYPDLQEAVTMTLRAAGWHHSLSGNDPGRLMFGG